MLYGRTVTKGGTLSEQLYYDPWDVEIDLDPYPVYRMLLLPLENVQGSPVHHPEGDVLYHSLQVFEQARDRRNYDEEFLLAAINQSVEEENAMRAASGRRLEVKTMLIGNRPSGETPRNAALVHTAIEATRLLGIEPILNRASTDANIPISLGIPAITIGVGGWSGDAHRLSEWYEPTGRETGYRRALLIALAQTGLSERKLI